MTLQNIKDKYAQDNWGYMKWETAVSNYRLGISDEDVDEVAKLYAKAKLEEAAEKARVIATGSYKLPYEVDKESITNINLD